MAGNSWDLIFKRDDLAISDIRTAPVVDPRPGEVRLAVEKFGLTTNNATYARFGASEIPFWDAFPGPEGYGRVPIWGFARVVESRHPDIAEGSRYFGYLPMSAHHTLAPQPDPRGGMVDTAPQREFLHPWYRTFQRAEEPDGLDDVRTLMRPIFPASFNLADALEPLPAQGVRGLVVTSASCKTAIGMLDELAARGVRLPAIGVTSGRHMPFLTRTGRYEDVVPYEALGSISLPAPAAFVDFTGAPAWRSAVYQHFAQDLRLGLFVGFTHPDATIQPPELPEPQPQVFFTPAVEGEAISREGADGYYSRYFEAEKRFLASTSWLRIEHREGPEAIVEAFQSLRTGEQAPEVANILRP